jgi:hypothetical protein
MGTREDPWGLAPLLGRGCASSVWKDEVTREEQGAGAATHSRASTRTGRGASRASINAHRWLPCSRHWRCGRTSEAVYVEFFGQFYGVREGQLVLGEACGEEGKAA